MSSCFVEARFEDRRQDGNPGWIIIKASQMASAQRCRGKMEQRSTLWMTTLILGSGWMSRTLRNWLGISEPESRHTTGAQPTRLTTFLRPDERESGRSAVSRALQQAESRDWQIPANRPEYPGSRALETCKVLLNAVEDLVQRNLATIVEWRCL